MVGRGRSRLAASESFGSLYLRHADNVLIFIARRVYDREVAMDLTAETFARAFVSRKRFRGGTEAEAEAPQGLQSPGRFESAEEAKPWRKSLRLVCGFSGPVRDLFDGPDYVKQ
jgi:hypothetical protein